ncbi:MAG TPA: deoxyribodipyrimidine photolyase [Prolixibacteraceae bacterium]|nr:deoxyribodipyrimidine photolyase [Prolixibacteraceae bacterium]
MKKIVVFWFRRDLRLHDNHGLFQALKSGLPVLPVFIFDTEILGKLSSKTDARVSFIYSEIAKLKTAIEKEGSSLRVFHSSPIEVFEKLTQEYEIDAVYTNHDYEPYAISRDKAVRNFLNSKEISFQTFKDQVIFEKEEVVKDDGLPYTVFTPYSRKWKQTLSVSGIPEFPSDNNLSQLLKTAPFVLPDLSEIGFEKSEITVPKANISAMIISNYEAHRDFPAIAGTTKLGTHLRFGTVSIRQMVRMAQNASEVFLNELIWREFFMQILWHFPQVENRAFKPKYDFIKWRNNETEFERWCNGQTGYPLVDAGMRELNATGFMHNRVRMVVASFLTKHLLIDWRWGEAYFAERLLDFELSTNNGNWQWAAGCGCDAAPYFRVFNPEAQQKKFDDKAEYILKWVPEYGTVKYPQPFVEHVFARERVLKVYKQALR